MTEAAQAVESAHVVYRDAVPLKLVDRLQRRLWIEVTRCGLTADDLASWHAVKCSFPALRHEPEVLAIRDALPPVFRQGEPCEPQILWHLPDEASWWPHEPHTDEAPPWAEGRRYSYIVGVALTEQTADNGCLHIWNEDGLPLPVEMQPGDLVAFNHDTLHAGALNRTGQLRAIVYFRFLEP